MVNEFIDLRLAMVALRSPAGCPSLRELARLAPARAPLSKSTVSNMVLGIHPPTLHQLSAFVMACGIDAEQRLEWIHA
ncbi:hypothetical protein [Streptomyces sp. NPDC005336]|uniref:hypothetical protein n=1 Tax=Streptomyces sp. NPDC005336 TaxID=3157035 RepID=UPI0033A91BC9